MACIAVTRVTVHYRHSCHLRMHWAHSHQCFRTPLLRSLLPSGNQRYSRNCNPCAHQRNFRADSNCMMVNTPTASQIPDPAQGSRVHPKKTRQGSGTPGVENAHNIQLRLRVGQPLFD